MGSSFKKQIAQRRAAIPQVDPESSRPIVLEPIDPGEQKAPPELTQQTPTSPSTPPQPEIQSQPPRLTSVDTSEAPVNRGFFMYPSRHKQVAKDLAYIEDRKPWQIIEDALEEYVVKHYGKEHKRK